MNKGNLNKLVTNYPVQLTNEEVENLSLTLSAVRTAGGGGEGKTYHGEGFVSVNNTNNSISLTTEANEKLNQPIPTKVSDLSDSANYQTVAGMDEYLTTANAQTLYQTKEAMSSYATREWTNDNFISEQELAGSVVPVVEAAGFAYKSYVDGELNKKENKLTFAYDNDKISAINGSALAGQGGVTGDYYSASNPSGFINSTQAETQILEKHYLTETSGNSLYVPIPNGLSDGQYYAMTTSSWKVIQGAGDVSGISTVAHDDTLTGNGNNENLGVDTTKIQTKLTDQQIQNITDVTTLKTASSTWDNVSAKLDTTAFSTVSGTFLTTIPDTYATKDYANNASANALSEAETWVESQHYLTEVPNTYATKNDLNTASSTLTGVDNALSGHIDYVSAHAITSLDDYYTKTQVDNTFASATQLNNYLTTAKYQTDSATFALKTEIPTTVAQLTDSGNYYKKTETSSKNELSDEFAKYVTSSNVTTQDTDYVMTTTGWKVLTLPGGGMTQVIHDETLTGQGNADNSKLGVVWSALSGNTIYSALSAGSATNALSAESARYSKQLKDASKTIQISDVTALQNWASSNSSTWDSVTAKLTTAKYANDSATFVTKPDTTQTDLNNNYLIYSTLTAAGTTTGWMPLSANYYSKTEADGRYQKILDMGNYLTTAKYATDSATFVTSSSNTITGTKQYALTTTGWSDIGLSNYLPLSGGTVTGDVTVSSNGTCLLAVGTEATLMGQSRVVNMGDTTARGTNWLGVSQSNAGFIKYVNGGNIGALNGTSIQINFAPDGANSYGNITVNSQDNISKVVHIPTASYDSMSSFDATNGPNYMLRKTASGFDIGACVINVTQLPAQTEANTYYFIYDT